MSTLQIGRNTTHVISTLDPKLQFPLGCSCRNCLIKSESKMAAVSHDGSRGLYSSVTIWSISMCDICIRPIFGSRNSNMTSFLSYQGSLGSKSKIALVGDGEYGVSITMFIQSLSMCNIPNFKARISFLIIFS